MTRLAPSRSHPSSPAARAGNVQEIALDIQSYSLEDELRRLAAHANAQGASLYTLQASGLQAGCGAGLALPSGCWSFRR